METDNKIVAQPYRYQYGCLMASLAIRNWKKIHSIIDPADIYGTKEDGYGKETYPHVTILFGFHDNPDNINKLQTELPINGPIKVPLVKLSHFSNDQFDVLKLDVDSDDLRMLNQWCKDNFEYTSSYPNYHPHVTVAYLKKGTGKKYDRDMTDSVVTIANKLTYSSSNRVKTKWSIEN